MKHLTINLLCFSLTTLLSCGHSDTSDGQGKKVKTDPAAEEPISVSECVKNIIYNKNEIDLNDYDSISTHYFHQLDDYTDPQAIRLSREMDSLRKTIHLRDNLNEGDYVSVLDRIDSLRMELSPYKKRVIGYAFVHTFYDGKDTISAIFVMDNFCGFGDMTEVKNEFVADPIDHAAYSEKVKNKDQ